ncbi:Cy140 [Cynomolgus cytomegalovirus]|uniref:Protein UL103 n=1 Tax=Cynomolgus macaque cytomegalovirus strain Mauritius TaxID=1690255 RepID=A0A0K1H007_9BETA|nr:Cy140 [Cynomolgus cytomegalovirus]AKT72740.1 protein UL103 [Cynomolgus macaque cytomegalovirus strain Mauritius]AXG21844.1 protein UL103 [synthetic construct]APT39304.1 Cy140 [Cynomolgus cytomegalovirus]APT39493.1 Cy140 [Cynomolgus cytomegalovirus]APT39688.1 Cy140 [Cynomolgus cytomegalovirus]
MQAAPSDPPGMDILMVRGVLEVHTDETSHNVIVTTPQIVDITVSNDRLWVHTDHGMLCSISEYRGEMSLKSSFVGYSTIFLLENEDAIKTVKLTSMRLKHRCGIVRTSNLMHFTLCTILSCVENLTLTRKCLLDLLGYLKVVNIRDQFGTLLRISCQKLICSTLYLFFDDKTPEIVQQVPKVFILFYESRQSFLHTILRFWFRITRQDESYKVTMKLMERQTLNGKLVEVALIEVLNSNFPSLPLCDPNML